MSTATLLKLRFECCSHCKMPCPLEGHSSPCPECKGAQRGRRKRRAARQ